MGAMKLANDPQIQSSVLLAAVAIHALLLIGLSSRRRRSGNRVLRFFLWATSTVYFPLMTYVLSYFTTHITSLHNESVLTSIVLIQFLKAKADMAALAVSAVASPAAVDDEINCLKIRPTTESLINSFWVAGLVIYKVFFDKTQDNKTPDNKTPDNYVLEVVLLPITPLWALGACRTVLRFAAFKRATNSFALGRNVQLISGYMADLQQRGCFEAEGQLPRLIVTGERHQDVEESPLGYRIKGSVLEDKRSSLVTLDRVWSVNDRLLVQELKDLCLSFALFKCLRRRFAGQPLVEAGSPWAFPFVSDRLLIQEGYLDHERIFGVIACELSFARGFYYSPLPVASLGTLPAALHFFLSLLIFISLCLVTLLLLLLFAFRLFHKKPYFLALLALVLAVVNACIEISEMVDSVRSNWTKISIIGHYIRCRSWCVRRIFSCLLRCKPPKHWKDGIRQVELLKPSLFCEQPWAHPFKQLFVPRKNCDKSVIKVSQEVRAAVLHSFRSSDGHLNDGTATVQRRCQAFTWACLGSGDAEVTTTTDAILVWCIATSLFDIGCPSRRGPSSSSTSVASSMLVAVSLSRYCMYLVAEAPDLLPDNSAWTKNRYVAVKEEVEALSKHSRAVPVLKEGVYQHLIDSFRGEDSHEVLKKGSRLGDQLVKKAAERPRGGEAGGEDAVWELLEEFWSEIVLYLAPSDNVKAHIEAVQRGGEFITLLWVLLLHAGITNRPARHVPEA